MKKPQLKYVSIAQITSQLTVLNSMANPTIAQDQNSNDVALDLSPFLKIYNDGRVKRLIGTATVPPGLDPNTGVQSKDVAISQDNNVGARIYIPVTAKAGGKIPVMVYIHGGGFCIESAWSPTYHNYLNALVSKANIIVVSVNYRLAPEFPLPTQYDDSWAGIIWVAAHSTGQGTEPWLNQYADFHRMYLAGDSAGGNITHHMSIKVGTEVLSGVQLAGVILFDPFFWGDERIGGESQREKSIIELLNNMTKMVIPDLKSFDHPWVNPKLEPEKLKKIGGKRMLLCVSGADFLLVDRGEAYYETLKMSGWDGQVEMFKSDGVGHVFFLVETEREQAVKLMKKVVDFINVRSG